MIKLFELGDNNMVTLNKPWISLVPELRALLARDKGSAGDGSGKYKKKATREFTAIFMLEDYHSPYESEPYNRRLQFALEASGISEDKWKEMQSDEEFMIALLKYRDMVLHSSTSLQTLRDMVSAKLSMNKFLRTINFSDETNAGGLKYDIKKIQDAIINMPKLEHAIAEMEEKVKMEINDTLDMRGGAEKGVEEDPDPDDYPED